MHEDFVNTNNRYMIDSKSGDSNFSNQGVQLTTYLASQYSFSSQTLFGDLLIQRRCFSGHSLLLLWPLWELLLTETPLIIVGDDPSECSHAVLIMLSILAPMRTTADYRPYLTLYESDVKEF